MFKKMLGLLCAASVFVTVSANAIVISADDSGWYDDLGFHDSTNENYIAGLCSDCGGEVFRNWFTFDVSGISGITAATLRLDTATVETDGTYRLYDVMTDTATLTAGGSGLTGIYDDLGMGTLFGDIDVLSTQDGEIIEITLNAAAIASIEAASGLWAIGGAFDGDLSLFFGSTGSLTRELVLETTAVPEPTTLAILGLGLFGLALRRKA